MKIWISLAAVVGLAASVNFTRSEVRIAGPIEYGQSTGPVNHSGQPKYDGFQFNARPSEQVEVTVSSKSGRMQAYLADSEYHSLAGGNPHFTAKIPTKSSAGTYYILVTEANGRPAVFTLDLERPSPKR